MSIITGLTAGIIIGAVGARLYYWRHIAIAQDVISAELAKEWVDRNNVDARFQEDVMSSYSQLEKLLNTNKNGYTPNKMIVCKDGESVSIQTGEFLYCSPRTNCAPWHEVEAGYPSCIPPESWSEYAEQWKKSAKERWYTFRYSVKMSAEADFKYRKTGNKYANFFRGFIRGLRRETKRLFIPQPCDTVYGYLPVSLVKEFIDVHGGEKDG